MKDFDSLVEWLREQDHPRHRIKPAWIWRPDRLFFSKLSSKPEDSDWALLAALFTPFVFGIGAYFWLTSNDRLLLISSLLCGLWGYIALALYRRAQRQGLIDRLAALGWAPSGALVDEFLSRHEPILDACHYRTPVRPTRDMIRKRVDDMAEIETYHLRAHGLIDPKCSGLRRVDDMKDEAYQMISQFLGDGASVSIRRAS